MSKSVFHNVQYIPKARLYAQAGVSDEEMEKARQLSWQKTREIAKKQIDKAKELLSDVSGIKWTEGVIPAYLHWKPFREVIDNAENNFKLGDNEADFDRKKEYYLLAWRATRISVEKVAEEAGKDRSYWSILAEPVVAKIEQKLDDVKKKAEEQGQVILKVVIGLAVLYVVLSARK